MPVGPHSEEFNIVSNDHWRTQKCDFCISVCKNNFSDHGTPDTIHRFRDSVLVCKMHDCYRTQKFRALHFFPSRDAKDCNAIHLKSNHFKMLLNISYIYLFKLYSISIILLLKNNLTNICSKISKIEMNLWMVWKALESTRDERRWMYFASLIKIMGDLWLY